MVCRESWSLGLEGLKEASGCRAHRSGSHSRSLFVDLKKMRSLLDLLTYMFIRVLSERHF